MIQDGPLAQPSYERLPLGKYLIDFGTDKDIMEQMELLLRPSQNMDIIAYELRDHA